MLDQQGQCEVSTREGESGIDRKRPLEQFTRDPIVIGSMAAQVLYPAQEAVIGCHAARPFGGGALDLGVLKPAREGSDDGLRHLVLNIEQLFEPTIVTFAPQVSAGCGIDELSRDAD